MVLCCVVTSFYVRLPLNVCECVFVCAGETLRLFSPLGRSQTSIRKGFITWLTSWIKKNVCLNAQTFYSMHPLIDISQTRKRPNSPTICKWLSLRNGGVALGSLDNSLAWAINPNRNYSMGNQTSASELVKRASGQARLGIVRPKKDKLILVKMISYFAK